MSEAEAPASVVTVLGARGRLGDAAVRAFAQAGWKVRAAVRPGSSGPVHALALPGVERWETNVADPDHLTSACSGAAVIFNGINQPYPQWHTEAVPILEKVLAAARSSGAAHLFPGNVYPFGPHLPETCGPSTPFAPGPVKKAQIRQAMELRLAEAAETGVQTLLLRAGDFYGGSKPGSWMDLVILEKVDRGILTYPGPLDACHAWAYLPDLAEAFVGLAERRAELSRFETFCFAGHALTGAELKGLVEAALGRPLRVRRMPWPFIRLAGWFSPMMREVSEMAYLWHSPHRLEDRHLDALLSRRTWTSPERAIENALAEDRSRRATTPSPSP